MPRLTEYELEREENIRQNQELLKSLGIFRFEIAPGRSKKPGEKKTSQKRRASSGDENLQPRRKSTRLAPPILADPPSSDPIDFLSRSPQRPLPLPSKPQAKSTHATSAPITLRLLPAPSIPKVDVQQREVGYRAPLPTRDQSGTLRFVEEPYFTPNLTPEEIIRAGSFGGTAFKPHHSTFLNCDLPEDDYTEFPDSWYSSLDIGTYLTSSKRQPAINKYGVNAGQTLEEWENAGWVTAQDPRGWFQWYCRFYLGRRTLDDERQTRRWLGVCGPSGRFKRSLVKKVVASGKNWNDDTISPVIRQTLQHWGYVLTEVDYNAYF